MIAEGAERERIQRILIVEDDDSQRFTLTSILEREGFEVLSCATGGEAIEQIRRASFGVAVVDLRLPDLEGTRLLEEIHRLNGSVHVIIYTAYGSFDSAKRAVNAGAFAYVEKAGDPGELVSRVHKASREQIGRYADDLEKAVAERTASLRESEERFRLMARATNDAVWDWDLTTNSLWWNEGLQTLFGYAAADIGSDIVWWEDRVHPEDREYAVEGLRVAVERGEQLWSSEYRFRRADGTYAYTLDRGYVIHDASGTPVRMIGAMLDLSERKRAERERERLEAQLRQAQKMEALGQLAGGVAHDFNNVLTVILGNTDLMLSRLARTTSGELHEHLKAGLTQVEEACERAAALTRQLLVFSRRHVRSLEVIEPSEIIAGLETMLHRLIGEHIRIRTTRAPDLGRIRADASQIEQVLMNLAVNARDAMPEGGDILIETANVELREEQLVEDLEAEPGPYVMIAVRDSGTGIDGETIDHIFEPFFTTKPVGKGTGLGLATVYGIVKQSKGHIEVESEAGRGTTFRVYFPRVEEELTRRTSQTREPDQGLRGDETILICEDESMLLSTFCSMLESYGYTVLPASNGAEAVDVLEIHDEKIDLLITDVIMPEMSGAELADTLRAAQPAIKLLFISGYTSDMLGDHGNLPDDVEFLEKPFTTPMLLRRVRDILDGQNRSIDDA